MEVSDTVTSKWAKGSGGFAGDECQNLVTHTLQARHDSSEDGTGRGTPLVADVAPPVTGYPKGDNPSREGLLVPTAFSCKDHGADAGEVAPTLRAMPHDKTHANGGGQVAVAVAIDCRQDPIVYEEHTGAHGASYPPHAVAFEPGVMSRDGGHVYDEHTGTIRSDPGDNLMSVHHGPVVRRITPLEAERLQGLPDHYTAVPWEGRIMADGPRYRMIGNGFSANVILWIGQRIKLFEWVAEK